MPYSVDDKCKKLAKCPEAAAIITEYSPGFTTDPQMKMVMGLTLRKLASFPQAKELADALDELGDGDGLARAERQRSALFLCLFTFLG